MWKFLVILLLLALVAIGTNPTKEEFQEYLIGRLVEKEAKGSDLGDLAKSGVGRQLLGDLFPLFTGGVVRDDYGVYSYYRVGEIEAIGVFKMFVIVQGGRAVAAS